MIVDYHLHLRDDHGAVAHGVDAVAPFLETALARGVNEIGFTEHVYYFRQTAEIWDVPYLSERCVYDLDAYCDAVLEAKRAGLLNRGQLLGNLLAGTVVGVVAIPLAMAFAIASGARPEQGLYTAIIAGLCTALFGGTRVQISGPTGAFIAVLLSLIHI